MSLFMASLVTLLDLQPAVAQGEGGTDGTAGAYLDDLDNPTAVASRVQGPPPPPRPPPASSNCEWRSIIRQNDRVVVYDEDGEPLKSETGRWLVRYCDGQPVLVNGWAYVPAGSGSGPDPAVVAREARKSVAVPVPPIATSPRADRRLYTGVRTWLWLDPSWWHGYSATADAGGVTATVSAKPVRAVWSMGDGGETTCAGPGVAWRPGMPDDATYCSYLYKHSSVTRPEGTFLITVTVDFDVTWTSSAGPGGRLARITRSAARAVEVGEIQAIETQ